MGILPCEGIGPFAWWGLEPLNHRRRDWQLRYAVAFRLNEGAVQGSVEDA